MILFKWFNSSHPSVCAGSISFLRDVFSHYSMNDLSDLFIGDFFILHNSLNNFITKLFIMLLTCWPFHFQSRGKKAIVRRPLSKFDYTSFRNLKTFETELFTRFFDFLRNKINDWNQLIGFLAVKTLFKEVVLVWAHNCNNIWIKSVCT